MDWHQRSLLPLPQAVLVRYVPNTCTREYFLPRTKSNINTATAVDQPLSGRIICNRMVAAAVAVAVAVAVFSTAHRRKRAITKAGHKYCWENGTFGCHFFPVTSIRTDVVSVEHIFSTEESTLEQQ